MMKGLGDTSFGSLIQTDVPTVCAGLGFSFCCPECSKLLTYLLSSHGPVCVIPFPVLGGGCCPMGSDGYWCVFWWTSHLCQWTLYLLQCPGE